MVWIIAHAPIEDVTPGMSVHHSLTAVSSLGADLVEVDVRSTADGQLVVAHDPRVGHLWIADTRSEDLPQLVPLPQVMESCANLGIGIYLDIKGLSHDGAVAMAALIRRTDVPIIAGSHRWDLLLRLASAGYDGPRSWLLSGLAEDPAEILHSLDVDYLHPCWERLTRPDQALTDGWLDRARQAGAHVITWHEERSSVLHELLRADVFAISTDDVPLVSEMRQNL